MKKILIRNSIGGSLPLIALGVLATLPLRAVDDLSLNGTTVTSGQTDNQTANVTITATNHTVNAGGQSNLTAGIRITLDPTSRINAGGGFRAMIDFNGNGISDATEYATRVAPPYFTSFESGAGFSLGNLNSQGNWFSGAGTVSIVNSITAADGTYSVDLPARSPTNSVIRHFAPMSGQATSYLDFFLKPVFTGSLNFSSYLDVGSAQVGFLQADATGRLQVLTSNSQGAAQWLTVGPPVALDGAQRSTNWLRLTLRLNFVTRVWDLFLDGHLIASGLPLNAPESFMPSFTLYGSTLSDTFLDDLYLNSANPLPADTVAPTSPSSLITPSATATSVNLFWAPGATNSALGVQGYNIYRNGALVGTTSGLKTYFTDQNLSASTTYTYTVQAFNSGGVASGQSTTLYATTAATSAPLPLEIFAPLK